MKRLIALLGLLAGFACALVFACKSSPVDVDAGVEVEAGMRGGPVVGSNPGQPFGPCPVGTDCYGSNWQKERTLFLQQIALALDASAGPGSGIFLNDAGVLTLAVPYQPALDGGFPSASTGQFFVQLSIGPGAATITGDLRCSTATPGLCTLVAIQGVPLDGGGVDGAVLTLINGQWSPQPAAVANYGLDLAAAADGGQVLVSLTGNDGGAALPTHIQGLAIDNVTPTFGITMGAMADAATAPAGIYLTPAAPNASAATTATGTPGSVHAVCAKALSTGNNCGFEVDYDGGAVATLTAMGPSSAGLCLGGAGSDAGGGGPGNPCTSGNAIVWTDSTNGVVAFNAPEPYSDSVFIWYVKGVESFRARGDSMQLDRPVYFLSNAAPGIPGGGSSGVLVSNSGVSGQNLNGTALWQGSGGYSTQFAPGGNISFGTPALTITGKVDGQTTANGDFASMQIPVPTNQSVAIDLTIDGRVTAGPGGIYAAVGDSISLVTFAALNNPTGTPAPLANHGTDQSWQYYSTSQATEVSSISTSASANSFDVVITQAGAPNASATILWTMGYTARFY